MPTEVRRLVFSNTELYAAFDQDLSKTGGGLPPGAVTRIRSGGAFQRTVKVDIHTTKGTADTMELQAQQVGGALIGHCICNQIPLPRSFAKSLIITGDNVALEMTNATGALVVNADDSEVISGPAD